MPQVLLLSSRPVSGRSKKRSRKNAHDRQEALVCRCCFESVLWIVERIEIAIAIAATHPMGLYGHEELVTSVKFTPNGRLVISGSDDRTVRAHAWHSQLHRIPTPHLPHP